MVYTLDTDSMVTQSDWSNPSYWQTLHRSTQLRRYTACRYDFRNPFSWCARDQVSQMIYDSEAGGEDRALAVPILSAWEEGTTAVELAPHETRVWVVDLDAGLIPKTTTTP